MTEFEIDNASSIVGSFCAIKHNILGINIRERGSGPRLPHEFDPNLFLQAVPHLSLLPGYVLDFCYSDCGMAGAPWVYGRRAEELAFTKDQADAISRERNESDRHDPLNFLIPDGSPVSWFERVVFQRLASQFYLYWHALYNDFRFVTTRDEVAAITNLITSGPDLPMLARSIDPRVIVTIGDTHIFVTSWGFSKWGGFLQNRYTFICVPPYSLIETKKVDHISYDCGICY